MIGGAMVVVISPHGPSDPFSVALEDSGYSVQTTDSASAAINALGANTELLVVYTSGLDAAIEQAIRRARERSRPEVIAVLPATTPDAKRLGLRLGADQVLSEADGPEALPQRTPAATPAAPLADSTPENPGLLVVDDDEAVLFSIQACLEQRFEVRGTTSPWQALEMLHEEPAQVLITDLIMDELTGIELITAARNRHPSLLSIVTTAYASKASAIAALKQGAYDYLHKPVDPEELFRAVDQAWQAQRYRLENRRLMRQLQETNVDLREARNRAEAASRAKSRFLANISHEVRTPLNGIVGSLALLESHWRDSSSSHEMVRQAMGSCDRLVELFSGLIDLAVSEEEAIRLKKTEFQLPEWLDNAVSSRQDQASQQDVVLRLDIADSVPGRAVGDGSRLRQIMDQLLDNAIKFSPDGGRVDVEATLDQDLADRFALQVLVRDQGIGIDNEMLEKVFEPFTQADDSLTRTYGGAGLGLSICRRVVTAMGGTIDISSQLGKGTEVKFNVLLDHAAVSATAAERHGVTKGDDPPRILIAEDDPVNQVVVRRMVELLGYRYEMVENGRQAVEACAGSSFDIVLMDCNMPEMDGFAATRAIRSEEPERRLYIIGLTGFALDEYRRRCLEAGMDDFLAKPYRLKSLQETLERRPSRSSSSSAHSP